MCRERGRERERGSPARCFKQPWPNRVGARTRLLSLLVPAVSGLGFRNSDRVLCGFTAVQSWHQEALFDVSKPSSCGSFRLCGTQDIEPDWILKRNLRKFSKIPLHPPTNPVIVQTRVKSY